ncbi:MAG: protein translocase subunit SecF [Clostridiales bacterium]|nr:protein translocase subunit SecF [Clostridiales bacterium]
MNFHFDFYKHRYVFFGVSLLCLLAGIVGGIANGGLNFDIQFEGGTLLELAVQGGDIPTGEVEAYVQDTFGKAVSAQIQTLYDPDAPEEQAAHLIIKASKSETMGEDEITQLVAGLSERYGIAEDQSINIQTVEPYIGAEMLRRGILAVIIATVLILLYVWIRFSVMSGLSAALCATMGLLHDALIMLAVYALFGIRINDSFIAAILTILGYSINDTIVIYDRIRENSRGQRKLAYTDLVNTSLNQTLTRSLNTTITTVICVVTVYVFATIYNITSLQDFCLPLIIGMVAGVYSTLFIVCQSWTMWQLGRQNRRIAAH